MGEGLLVDGKLLWFRLVFPSSIYEAGFGAFVQNDWLAINTSRRCGANVKEVVFGFKTNDELTSTTNTDHDHWSSDHGGCTVPTFPHASLETVSRLHVRCYGPERSVSCSPWRQDIWRCAVGAPDGAVVAGHARRPLHPGSWDLCCEYIPPSRLQSKRLFEQDHNG